MQLVYLCSKAIRSLPVIQKRVVANPIAVWRVLLLCGQHQNTAFLVPHARYRNEHLRQNSAKVGTYALFQSGIRVEHAFLTSLTLKYKPVILCADEANFAKLIPTFDPPGFVREYAAISKQRSHLAR